MYVEYEGMKGGGGGCCVYVEYEGMKGGGCVDITCLEYMDEE